MELKRLTEHIWYMPYETERDRPNLGYVLGERWSLAVDAGHSEAHTKEFYALLEKENLPLPSITVLTHWHWDHTFGMHAVNGLCIANELTDKYLKQWKEKIENNGTDEFFSLSESIRHEYKEDDEVIVKTADITFSGEMTLNLGDVTVRLVQSESPHTDDSTLVYVCEDKTLFLGDSTCQEFGTGLKDKALCRKLYDTVRSINPEICLEGHWVSTDTEDSLSELMN